MKILEISPNNLDLWLLRIISINRQPYLIGVEFISTSKMFKWVVCVYMSCRNLYVYPYLVEAAPINVNGILINASWCEWSV